ncbi:MAG: branched-chain amino acid ABC transporter permease [Armatimonadetes bacterium Cent15-Ar3]|nr:MAG: branched-chain amino acid ABC transporter permease [Armatimonadetes bacterium Cent15-Ar3]
MPQQLVNGFLLGAIYALVALGYTMVYGVLKLINFAHGEVFMLGSYGAMFASWMMGFGPGGSAVAGSWVTLLLMLLMAMLVSGSAGFVIERFAYRPIRNHPRIASLITAIGLSLLLQYGGQAFLLEGKKQAITSKVNPFSDDFVFTPKKADAGLVAQAAALQPEVDAAQKAFDARLPFEKSKFELSPEGDRLNKALAEITAKRDSLQNQATTSAVTIRLPKGKLIMLTTTILLMIGLWYLVMKTRMGRAMRAVSVDFNASSLMGINLNTVISFTFILGSVLAGAGAMMYSTFQSAPIDPFSGTAPGVKAFVAAVLGGIGNIPGAVVGAILMGVAENLVTWAGYSSYRDAIAFVILIAVLLFKPGGLLGSNKVEKV